MHARMGNAELFGKGCIRDRGVSDLDKCFYTVGISIDSLSYR